MLEVWRFLEVTNQLPRAGIAFVKFLVDRIQLHIVLKKLPLNLSIFRALGFLWSVFTVVETPKNSHLLPFRFGFTRNLMHISLQLL